MLKSLSRSTGPGRMALQPDILAAVAEKYFKLNREEWLGFREAAEDVV